MTRTRPFCIFPLLLVAACGEGVGALGPVEKPSEGPELETSSSAYSKGDRRSPRTSGDRIVATRSNLDIRLHLNLGDSVGAGYDARGQNDVGGRGYARLLYENHDRWPTWERYSIRARFPEARFVDRARSGSTSADMLGQLDDLPDADGDTLVTIYVGGNDLNDDLIATLLLGSLIIERWEQNVTLALQWLRARYHHPDQGRHLIVVLATVHDPTDATLRAPRDYDDGFCEALHRIAPYGFAIGELILGNLHALNERIRSVAEAHDAVLLDAHELLRGHGLFAAEEDRWIADDCAHLLDDGHHALRAAAWYGLSVRL